MVTMHRRRAWRDKRTHHPATLADLMRADMMIGVHCALAGFFTALIILVALFGQGFVNLFFGG